MAVVRGSPFKIDWSNKAAVIAYAQRLDEASVIPQVVYKRSDRPNYNIAHAVKIEAERLQCYVYGIGFEVVWEGTGKL